LQEITATAHGSPGRADVEAPLKIRREFAGTMALNCYVIKPSKVAVDDPVTLI
jgi:hypothetical protein